MAKVGVATVISIILNLFLTFWLVNQYMSDVYFKAYVDATIGQYYPFIVLSLGVGGGSGLGYAFLKRRHGDSGLLGSMQKSKSFKPVGPLASPSRQILPTGAPPSPASKHTVYAVPALPKTSTPSSSRTVPSATLSASSRSSLDSILAPKQDTSPKSEPFKPPSPSFSPTPQSQPLRSIGETPTRQTTSWGTQQSGSIFQKPGLDVTAKQDSSPGFPGPSPSPQSTPVPSKWAPPEDRTGTGQFSEGGVKSIPPLPTKWAPPPGAPSSQERPPPPQGFPRPGPPGPGPARGPFPPPQGGPRPFVIQGPGGPGGPGQPRPMGPPRPIAAPQPFRPDLNRPPPPIGGQPRPPQPIPRPAAPLAGPMPQPWTPPGQAQEKKEQSGPGSTQTQPSGTESSAGKQVSDQKGTPEGSGGGGEMDWDTALDTILKTLRKDRVGDTK